MNTDNDLEEVFIKNVRNRVHELHRQATKQNSETVIFIEKIKYCMTCLWKEVMVDRGWAGTHEEWVPKKMDAKQTITIIQKMILPRLQDALKNVSNDQIHNLLTVLIQDIEIFFVTWSGDDDVNVNARVEKLEEEVQELRTKVEALVLQHPPETLLFEKPPLLERSVLLGQLARHT